MKSTARTKAGGSSSSQPRQVLEPAEFVVTVRQPAYCLTMSERKWTALSIFTHKIFIYYRAI